MANFALLIGVSDYGEGFDSLPAAPKDAYAMERVLREPQRGGVDDVKLLINPNLIEMQKAIETLFLCCKKNDLTLLFFSGHGLTVIGGKFYLTTRDSCKNQEGQLLKSTAVPASFVHDIMNDSRSSEQVVILDCCFSGAFAKDLLASAQGKKRVVLTSSTSAQYSFEEVGSELSIYTRYLVEGIKTGAADLNNDGAISVNELHDYASRKVQEAAPAMKPKIYAVEEGFNIQLAKASISERDPKLAYRRSVEDFASRGEISDIGRRALDELREQLGLLSEDTAQIEAEVLQPYREYQRKLQLYEQLLTQEIERVFS